MSCARADSVSFNINSEHLSEEDEGVMRLWKLKELGTYPSSVDEEEYQLKYESENSERDQMETAADALVSVMFQLLKKKSLNETVVPANSCQKYNMDFYRLDFMTLS